MRSLARDQAALDQAAARRKSRHGIAAAGGTGQTPAARHRGAAFRGNVHSRLRKIDDGEIDATILGMAGLKRLGLADAVSQVLSIDEFLPAVGQGAVAIEARENDEPTRDLLAVINHVPTAIAVTAERAFLTVLDGSCRTPIAGHAVVSGNALTFRGMIFTPWHGRIRDPPNRINRRRGSVGR